MKPGDVRTFKRGKGNAVVVAVGVWAKRTKKDSPIHIHLTGIRGKHTTVTNQPESERYHRTLFRDLRDLLIAHHCWLYGADGSETHHRK